MYKSYINMTIVVIVSYHWNLSSLYFFSILSNGPITIEKLLFTWVANGMDVSAWTISLLANYRSTTMNIVINFIIVNDNYNPNVFKHKEMI